MDLSGWRTVGRFSERPPKVNSQNKHCSHGKETQPSNDDGRGGDAFAIDPQWIAADLAKCEITEDDGG
jgi:hypothetical protein